MAVKLSSKQQAQLGYLDQLVAKVQRVFMLIEKMNQPSEAETAVRQLARLLDQIKVEAAGLSLNGVADSAANMAGLARRTGGVQTRIRGLRDGLVGLRINADGARKSASKPADEDPVEGVQS